MIPLYVCFDCNLNPFSVTEMESFRRSFDRSREQPGLKKPRLAEESIVDRSRSFGQRPAPSASGSSASRYVNGDIEADSVSSDLARGTYPQQQHHELVNRYKATLSELTINSKPMITNLTIIAGEYSQHAKAIAAIICANIIEVPNDQKLPSLYLLDCIVKNIGRDYIKHFAGRLPEVFCKVYRMVDPSLHISMRHLFGTWKGVFPPQPLQMIEKELGFSSAVNGSSSSSAAAMDDTQSNRPAQSIHVNPKYLEARQRNQLSTRDPRREAFEKPVLEKKNNPAYGDIEYGSDLPKRHSLGMGHVSEGIADQDFEKTWNDARVSRTISNQRNGFDTKPGMKSFQPSKSTQNDAHLKPAGNISNRSSTGMNPNWKNSDEEEYAWDDINPRFSDQEIVDQGKVHWMMDNSEERGINSRNSREASADILLEEQSEVGAVMGNHRSLQKVGPHSTEGINHSSYLETLPKSFTTSSSRVGSLQSALPSKGALQNVVKGAGTAQNSLASTNYKPLTSRYSPEVLRGSPEQKSPQAPDLRNIKPRDQFSQMPMRAQTSKSHINLQKTQPYGPSEHKNPPTSGLTKKSKLPEIQLSDSVKGMPASTSLLDSIMKSGILNNTPVLGRHLNRVAPSPPVGSGPSAPSPNRDETLSIPTVLPSTADSPTVKKLKVGNTVANPVSSLLGSLVAKGLISASKKDPQKQIPSLVKNNDDITMIPSLESIQDPSVVKISSANKDPQKQILSLMKNNDDITMTTPSLEPNQVPSGDKISSANDEHSHPESDYEALIGYEFRPSVIREPHPTVISELLQDSLLYTCLICSLKFRCLKQHDRHMEWHALKSPELHSLIKASRSWYGNVDHWVAEKRELPFLYESVYSGHGSEECNQMVPADEDQCLCVLCGEPFEDMYSHGSGEWMFKGAVYMTISSIDGKIVTSTEGSNQGLIVHPECITESTVQDLGLTSKNS